MSAVKDAFEQAIGVPMSTSELGFRFSMEWDQVVLDDLVAEIGAGVFKDGFLFLLGEEIETASEYLKYWAFLFDDDKQRKVIGMNAYGSLLVVEDEEDEGTMAPVGYVDVLNCRYVKDENLDFIGLFGNWLPNDKLELFLDDSVYKTFVSGNGALPAGEILGIKVPISLGGKMEIDNFQAEPVEAYYESITAIYKNAMNG
jgi:hypothetical protein